MFLFVLNNSKMPNPLPVNNPANIVPRVISLAKYNSVIITLPAQFGIKPIRLDAKYVNILLLKSILDNVSSPTLYIIIFINKLAIRTNNPIFKV